MAIGSEMLLLGLFYYVYFLLAWWSYYFTVSIGCILFKRKLYPLMTEVPRLLPVSKIVLFVLQE